MRCTPDDPPLPLLLGILKEKQLQLSIASVVTDGSVDLARKLLSGQDHVNVAEQLNCALDVENMLDFMLCLICNGHFSSSDNLRARRLMFKVLRRTPVIPRSLFVAGVSIPANRDYIGAGAFGVVLKGELGGNLVALKVLYKTRNDIEFCREALMWRSLNHKFVLPFLGIHEDESASHFFLVSPYMKNGTLADWRKNVYPSVAEVEERMLEVAQGLQYIHSEGVVHGDLRGSNVLLDADLHVQIADFGLTRISEATATHTQALSYNFAAPELFGHSEAPDGSNSDKTTIKSQKSDVYAFGCLYYEIHYNTIPFSQRNLLQIPRLVSEGERPLRLNEPPLTDRVWNLISECWSMKAAERPTIEGVVAYMMDSDSRFPRHSKKPRFGWGIAMVILSVMIMPTVSFLISNLLGSSPILFHVIPPFGQIPLQVHSECGQPLTTVENWHVQVFRPKWFGLFGEPAPIVYQTPSGDKAHQISVVDLDKRDIEIRISVDNRDRGFYAVDMDPTVDCGDDLLKCLDLGFGSALIVVPPGRHTVKAEIKKKNESEAFVWGKERRRRIMWLVQQCP